MSALSDVVDQVQRAAQALADYASSQAQQDWQGQTLQAVADGLKQASDALAAQGMPPAGEGGGGAGPGPAAGGPAPGGETPPPPAPAAFGAAAQPRQAGVPPTPASPGAARRK